MGAPTAAKQRSCSRAVSADEDAEQGSAADPDAAVQVPAAGKDGTQSASASPATTPATTGATASCSNSCSSTSAGSTGPAATTSCQGTERQAHLANLVSGSTTGTKANVRRTSVPTHQRSPPISCQQDHRNV